jgi:hypothetical protein
MKTDTDAFFLRHYLNDFLPIIMIPTTDTDERFFAEVQKSSVRLVHESRRVQLALLACSAGNCFMRTQDARFLRCSQIYYYQAIRLVCELLATQDYLDQMAEDSLLMSIMHLYVNEVSGSPPAPFPNNLSARNTKSGPR